MQKSTEILIDKNGNIKCLYTDLIDLRELGTLHVERASHVEFDEKSQTWSVRLADTGKLIGSGFESRPDALAFEVKYLNRNLK